MGLEFGITLQMATSKIKIKWWINNNPMNDIGEYLHGQSLRVFSIQSF